MKTYSAKLLAAQLYCRATMFQIKLTLTLNIFGISLIRKIKAKDTLQVQYLKLKPKI